MTAFMNADIAYLGTGPDDRFASSIDAAFVTDDEMLILKKLRGQILQHARPNRGKSLYYEAKQIIRHLDIAVPRSLTDIGTAVGWAGTVVDTLDERVDFLGWATPSGDLNGLDYVFDDNDLGVESNFGHVDALITGTSFVTVGNDPEFGAERQHVAIESSATASVIWDYRLRRSVAGLSQVIDERGFVKAETLYLEDANLVFERDDNGRLVLISRDQHNVGRCFMTRLPNRCTARQLDGRSEITPAVRYLTDAAVRTMLGMEVNREFYTAPQRFVLNAKPEDFGVTSDMTPEQKYRKGLAVAMGMVNIVPGREDNTEGDPLSVVEMKPAAPTPYIEQVRAYSMQLSGETGIPAPYLGFVTENPSSADAIRQLDYRLVKRSQRRLGGFGMGWREVGLLCVLARDGSADFEFFRTLKPRFADPATPTKAATADELQKMVASGILVPDSKVTYDRYGLTELEVEQLIKDKQAYEAKQLRDMVRQQALTAAAPGQPSPTKSPAKGPDGGTE